VAKQSGLGAEKRSDARRGQELHESNPMLGHRGCRLGVTYPEIYEMQARAIFEAALAMWPEGKTVVPEIMIPLVATKGELRPPARPDRRSGGRVK
jgi:pyruvate,orthophosphate dikinase